MELIKLGAEGPEVRTLQQRLQAAGYDVAVDGDFGPNTEAAVKQLQRDRNLVEDGIVGPKTMAALLGRDTRHLLSQTDIESAAEQLGVDIATVHAVKAVESRGRGFLDDGRPVILFERHIMRRRLAKNGFNRGEIHALCTRYPGLVSKTPGGYRGLAAEHFRLNNARKIDDASALESCSWGLFQIMGYHWERLGFESAQAFVNAMTLNEGNQLYAFVGFVQSDPDMLAALQAKDWAGFARRYNGPGYRKNQYDTRLARAYARYQEQEQAA
jgi:hypothetical protein